MDNDELISQFMAVTGCTDTDQAGTYLEMSGGNVETAAGLYFDHQTGGGDSGGVAAGGMMGGGMGGDDIRAPDATQNLRLVDDIGHGGMMGGMIHHPYMDPVVAEQLQTSAFAPVFDAREAVNAAAAADSSDGEENMDQDGADDADGGDDSKPKSNIARLADMFSPPEHLIFKEGGFEGARNMAKDNKRWLLVNIQRDSEFSCHALNRDVWRDELVENLIREGFIFWQAVSLLVSGHGY